MAKKKNQSKKHRFKYTEPTATPVVAVAADAASVAPTTAVRSASPGRTGLSVARDFSYVGSDLRRIGLLAASLVAVELLLWWLLGHTSVGSTIYRLVQV